MSEGPLLNILKTHRTKAGLTQAELAIRAGVSRKTINTIENSVFVPSTILSLTLAHVLGVSVEDIFTLAAPPDPSEFEPE
jgi:putative transcriptional regulator